MGEMICEVPRCRQDPVVTYYNRGVCQHHWEKHCAAGPFSLKVTFGITEKDDYHRGVIKKKTKPVPPAQAGRKIL